ncbi:hypothetical protein HELRODRAFT_191731 [Helobdella robusta]|uniref:BEACH domain-containing protein n=1 Tax=Helobdella robusta TaxID=6412 RepID=T1FT87_HELRO|nr:hypothetical protein HELRODRAFT_191731 [Helobdella robusta]ESO04795.1 hypothetical protein HELRODRAFT_191731 [Helobdella robusta]
MTSCSIPCCLLFCQNSARRIWISMILPIIGKNICAQTPTQEEKRTAMYNALESLITTTDSLSNVCHRPYHSHNFVSNAAVVYQYNLRLPPFTQLFVQFQGGKFDCPDRVFNSIKEMYRFVTTGINNDAKELLPEFFYLPEFLVNSEGFNLGRTHNGHEVDDVILPPWAKGDPRLFVLVHRQALESQMVVNNLAAWIDLVFGYKQAGEAAKEAFNVYHPNAYFSTLSSIDPDDETRLRAVISQVRSCGQVPKQLFHQAHPLPNIKSVSNVFNTAAFRTISPLDTVSGLRWGNYVGSPEQVHPHVVWIKHYNHPIDRLVCAGRMKLFVVSGTMDLLLRNNGAEWSALIWRDGDGYLNVKNCPPGKRVSISWPFNYAQITCTYPVVSDQVFFFGTQLGLIYACKMPEQEAFSVSKEKKQQTLYPYHQFTTLVGHSSYITDMKACEAFRMLYSSSADGNIIFWDLNRLSYIRSVRDHKTQVEMICICTTTADLASVSYLPADKEASRRRGSDDVSSLIMLHTINGKKVSQQLLVSEKVTCLTFSSREEGRSVNVLVAATMSGVLRLYSSWDLMFVKEVRPFIDPMRSSLSPIRLITYCCDDKYLVGSTFDNVIFILAASPDDDLKQLSLIYV